MSFKTDSFVLRSRPWTTADRLYDLFTPYEGVIRVLLKSGQKAGNKLSGQMLPFSKVRVMIGRGRMDHLAGADTIKDFPRIRQNLHLIFLASSVAELLINETSQSDKAPEFQMLDQIFGQLDDPSINLAQKIILTRIFLWKYLSLAGWQPRFGQGIIYMSGHTDKGQEISDNLQDFIKYIIQTDLDACCHIKIGQRLNQEWLKLSQNYYQTVYDFPSKALKLFNYA